MGLPDTGVQRATATNILASNAPMIIQNRAINLGCVPITALILLRRRCDLCAIIGAYRGPPRNMFMSIASDPGGMLRYWRAGDLALSITLVTAAYNHRGW